MGNTTLPLYVRQGNGLVQGLNTVVTASGGTATVDFDLNSMIAAFASVQDSSSTGPSSTNVGPSFATVTSLSSSGAGQGTVGIFSVQTAASANNAIAATVGVLIFGY